MHSDEVCINIAELGRQQGLLLQRVYRIINEQMLNADANTYKYKISSNRQRITWHLKYYKRIYPFFHTRQVVRLSNDFVKMWYGGKEGKDIDVMRNQKGIIVKSVDQIYANSGPRVQVRWLDPHKLKKVCFFRIEELVYE